MDDGLVELQIDLLCYLRERIRSILPPEEVLSIEIVQLLLQSSSLRCLFERRYRQQVVEETRGKRD